MRGAAGATDSPWDACNTWGVPTPDSCWCTPCKAANGTSSTGVRARRLKAPDIASVQRVNPKIDYLSLSFFPSLSNPKKNDALKKANTVKDVRHSLKKKKKHKVFFGLVQVVKTFTSEWRHPIWKLLRVGPAWWPNWLTAPSSSARIPNEHRFMSRMFYFLSSPLWMAWKSSGVRPTTSCTCMGNQEEALGYRLDIRGVNQWVEDLSASPFLGKSVFSI